MADVTLPTRRGLLQVAVATSTAASLASAKTPSTADPVENRARLAADPLRPRFHLLPPAGWMNDPNGPIWFAGRYHLFYQYNPKAAAWGHIQWGHAVSADMIHWRHLPIALSPTPGGPDADGVFSGTAIADGGRAHILYTGVRAGSPAEATIRDARPPLVETQCLATATDATLARWDKRPHPVIAAPPSDMVVNGFRDPAPWRQGDWWYMLLGSGLAGRGGAVLLYRSRDLVDWRFVRVFAQRDPTWFEAFDPWEVWECPDFFALDDRHVLLFSARGKAYWQSGRLDETTMHFRPERTGILDYGSMYAPKSQRDAQGRRILWGWIQETRPDAEQRAAGWSGMMTLPRVLTIGADGALRQTPLPELARLRGRRVDPGAATIVPGCCGEVEIVPRDNRTAFDLAIGDGAGATWLSVVRRAERPDMIEVDGRPIPSAALGAIRALVDGSVIELSIDDRLWWTKRFYYDGPQRDASLRWASAAAARVSVWPIEPISSDRLTR